VVLSGTVEKKAVDKTLERAGIQRSLFTRTQCSVFCQNFIKKTRDEWLIVAVSLFGAVAVFLQKRDALQDLLPNSHELIEPILEDSLEEYLVSIPEKNKIKQ
jgi:hypothetical protein